MIVTIQNELFTLATQNRDPYDLRQPPSQPFPPEYYVNYLQIPSVVSAIGAETTYVECAGEPYNYFAGTGDVRRVLSCFVFGTACVCVLNLMYCRTQELCYHSSRTWQTPVSGF
jgi:hypothetical protein